MTISDRAARQMFFVSALLMSFAYGVIATHYSMFPVDFLKEAKLTAEQLLEESGATLPWYYRQAGETTRVRVHAAGALARGLRLIGGKGADEINVVNIMDAEGRLVHRWEIDWFKIWPNPEHLDRELTPMSNGGLVHGVLVMPNGDLIFNFYALGLVRLDACGGVVWKLPYRTHHSLSVDGEGNIWAPGVITRREKRADRPNYEPNFEDYTIVQVSPSGHLLRELSVADLLIDNDMKGLLYMGTLNNRRTRVWGDTLHLNDVEVFPASMAPGTFRAGDVMISLRNVNTIVVFDPSTLRVKFSSVGAVLRQHDPDFVDGNTISVFDNNNLAVGPYATPDAAGHYSRIVRLSPSTRELDVRFSGTDEQPFFTDVMGNHQVLPNNNTLVTESITGRVIEIDANGRILWEYFNLLDNGLIGVVDDALVLPPEYDETFFAQASSVCRGQSGS